VFLGAVKMIEEIKSPYCGSLCRILHLAVVNGS